MATCNPSTLIESAKCFQCLSKKELQAVIAQLLCNISSDGQIVTAPNGTRYRVIVANDGTLTTEAV
jgi:hypothetical protein